METHPAFPLASPPPLLLYTSGKAPAVRFDAALAQTPPMSLSRTDVSDTVAAVIRLQANSVVVIRYGPCRYQMRNIPALLSEPEVLSIGSPNPGAKVELVP